MTKEEIDVLWQQAISESMKETQYKFVNLILESVAVECDSLEYAFKPGHECAESIRSLKA